METSMEMLVHVVAFEDVLFGLKFVSKLENDTDIKIPLRRNIGFPSIVKQHTKLSGIVVVMRLSVA